ncbi:MAG: hypothetical protein M1837_004970 [Sclerophora amabilis]|nr:MAG: hypothetical protein M1837_004970 [Sclerophora amabilis]
MDTESAVIQQLGSVSLSERAAPGLPVLKRQDDIVRMHLCAQDETFRTLNDLQEKGWRSAQADEYFKLQRERSDNANEKIFYKLHKHIGREMDKTGAFSVIHPGKKGVQALNLCMAPGAYTWKILQVNRQAHISGISLPTELGGRPMVLPYGDADDRVEVLFADITLFSTEFGVPLSQVPPQHPEAAKFSSQRPFLGTTFDIVLCDGNVLRTHERAEWRELHEPNRLTKAQLILGMQRIRKGGTFIILLHKSERWDNVQILRSFEGFSKIKLFKPASIFGKRSSFYLVAKKVDPTHPDAISAVEKWKADWKKATFPAEDGDTKPDIDDTDDDDVVRSALADFGPRLIELGRPIWAIQGDALSRAAF